MIDDDKVTWTSEYEKLENFSNFDVKIKAKNLMKKGNRSTTKKNWFKDNTLYILIIMVLLLATLYSLFK